MQALDVFSWHNLGLVACVLCLLTVTAGSLCPFVRVVCLLPEFVVALPCPCHTEEEDVNSPVASWAVSSFTGKLKPKLGCLFFSPQPLSHL